jgi:hypothetical protein
MKLFALIVLLAHSSGLFITQAQAEIESQSVVCGSLVAAAYLHEVKVPNKPDKYRHCSISCVMALYCGPVDAYAVGALKEVYDAMGFGDPEMADLKADEAGIKEAVKMGFILGGSREKCYQACGKLYP